MNGDGLNDILVGSYSGKPQLIVQTKDGYGTPTSIKDKNGDLVVLSAYWNNEIEDWSQADQASAEGHCTSVASVDWDDDGDMDLLLGCYRNGGLYLRLNEGSPSEMKFAATNQPVKVGDEAAVFEGGIGAPRIADWDNDGLFDILIGTIYGEVVLLRNAGSQGAPSFPNMTTLVEALPGDAGAKQIKRVPAEDGSPVAPGSSFHIEVVDYDHDGDLDLLVGGRSEWLTGPEKEPTAEDLERQQKLTEQAAVAWQKFKEFKKDVTDKEALKELKMTDEYKSHLKTYHSFRKEAYAVTADPVINGDFVWLFRRK